MNALLLSDNTWKATLALKILDITGWNDQRGQWRYPIKVVVLPAFKDSHTRTDRRSRWYTHLWNLTFKGADVS
jgi:hypothetical protein